MLGRRLGRPATLLPREFEIEGSIPIENTMILPDSNIYAELLPNRQRFTNDSWDKTSRLGPIHVSQMTFDCV